MSDILIEVESGKSKRLKTANKVCKEDIVVTGVGGSGGDSQSSDLFPYMTGAPAFANADITAVTDDIVLHMENTNSMSNAFSGAIFGCKKLTVYISSKCTTFFRAFRLGAGLEEIEIIGDTSSVVNFSAAFTRVGLKRVLGDFDFSSISIPANQSEMFGSALEEFYPVANTIKVSISFYNCANLIPKSVQAIIDGLADLTGGTTQTLTLHATVGGKLTDEQKATITAKNWELVY